VRQVRWISADAPVFRRQVRWIAAGAPVFRRQVAPDCGRCAYFFNNMLFWK